jgi:hypothetical protein
MDGLTLLAEARAAGLTVTADRNQLVIRGPRRAEDTARRLLANKSLVLNALAAAVPPGPTIVPDHLPIDWYLQWDERAAIMEVDGELPRERAEALALLDILEQMRRYNEESGRPP